MYDNDKARVGHDDTDFAAYGLPNPRDQYGNRDIVNSSNPLLDSGVKPSNESLRDSFLDLLNYSAIAMMVLDGVWPEVQEPDCD